MLSKNRKWCHDLKIDYGVKVKTVLAIQVLSKNNVVLILFLNYEYDSFLLI